MTRFGFAPAGAHGGRYGGAGAGAGWYITGWLLDPSKLVSAVMLHGPAGVEGKRLDSVWTRLPREDVSAGFRGNPLFEGRISDDLHGFTVFVADDKPDTSPGSSSTWAGAAAPSCPSR